MEIDYSIVGSVVATAIAVVSFFKSNKKEQSDLDKEQTIDIKVMQEKQISLGERLAKIESVQETLEGKLTKEVEKVYDRIGSMEAGLREDFRNLTNAIINQNKRSE